MAFGKGPNIRMSQVFLEICKGRPASIAAVALPLGVKPRIVAHQVKHLQLQGLVSRGQGFGRVRLDPDAGSVIGIDLGGSHVHYALADFSGEILAEATEKVRPEYGPRKLTAQLIDGIRRLKSKQKRRAVRVIAVGVPSSVDQEHGLVIYANNLPGWTNIPLGRVLTNEFRMPILLDKDTNMAAIGEHWKGAARGVDNFVFVALGTGIGCGIIIDGKLYRGFAGAAGEIYLMNLDWSRWAEDFRDTGYFEKYASGRGIAEEGRRQLPTPRAQQDHGLSAERNAFFVFEAFQHGDSRAQVVLEKTFTVLGVGLANIATVLDPGMIVLGGGVVKGAPTLMLRTVRKVISRLCPNPPRLKLSSLGDKAQTFGAIASALEVARRPANSPSGSL